MESLSYGEPWTIKAGIVYCLPSKLCRVQALGPVTVSVDGITFSALTGADTTGIETAAMFIKAAADTLVICKGF